MGLMTGKNVVIFGVANKRSIAWGCAKALSDQGMRLAFMLGRIAEVHELEPTPEETLEEVGREAHALVAEQYRCLAEDLTPALRDEGIRIRCCHRQGGQIFRRSDIAQDHANIPQPPGSL